MMKLDEIVIEFVAEFVGVDSSEITPDTLINMDLGVDGDDGLELLEEFSSRFSVDLSGVEENYFGPEGFPISIFIWPILWLLDIFGRRQALFKDLDPLPVATLIRSAKLNRWSPA